GGPTPTPSVSSSTATRSRNRTRAAAGWAAEEPHARVPSAAFDGGHAVADAPERPGPGPSAHDSGQPDGAARAQDTSGFFGGRPSAAPSRPAPGADEASVDSEALEAAEEAQGAVEAAERAAEAERAAGARAELTADGDDAEVGVEAADEQAPDGRASDERALDEQALDEQGADSDESPATSALPGEEHPLASYVLRVNGVDRPVTDAWIGESLLYVLRERLGLAGAKDGCSQGECGACNVQVDGRLVASCLSPAVTAAGSEVRTVEGLAEDGHPSDVQRALARCGAVQCGFCVPGMAMTVHDLLEGNPAPTELETRQALCGNLCRCSGYRGVVEAVKEVVAEREAHAAADAETDGDEARIPHQAGPGAGGVNPSAFAAPGSQGAHEQAYGQGQDGGQA
ncbi:(2Fe-2S)-binding protein, partial [Streptomyces sp. NPDC047072]|uniref:(2Fe-2S)-binding protein n=1 Tax=Streptomyces sp. NPDC047072 TaxID=3154809 RepID=UPI0033C5D4E6